MQDAELKGKARSIFYCFTTKTKNKNKTKQKRKEVRRDLDLVESVGIGALDQQCHAERICHILDERVSTR